MKREEMREYLQEQELNPFAKKDLSRLWLSSNLIRCQAGDTMLAAMGNVSEKDDQIHALVDAVHWHIQTKGTSGTLHFVIGKRDNTREMEEVINAVALLIASLKIPLRIEVGVDFDPCYAEIKPFDISNKKWLSDFKRRRELQPPPLALKLSKQVDDESFRWYRSITGKFWSGRVEGLQVCTVLDDSNSGILEVGKQGKIKDGPAREAFSKIAGHVYGDFGEARLPEVATIIKELVKERRSGDLSHCEPEHLLESRILRGVEKIVIGNQALEPVCKKYPFQFPTYWSPGGSPRFVDALMQLVNEPWVVELKVNNGSSPGQYYRHAITQAVLYREYIKRCDQLHGWFFRQSLDPLRCKAAVAFPQLDKNNETHQRLLEQHKEVGKAFGVQVIEIKATRQ